MSDVSKTSEELLAKVMDTLAYYQCRASNPKADHPIQGYHAFSEDQRDHLREKQREGAEEIVRMFAATRVPVQGEPNDEDMQAVEEMGGCVLPTEIGLRAALEWLAAQEGVRRDWYSEEAGAILAGIDASRRLLAAARAAVPDAETDDMSVPEFCEALGFVDGSTRPARLRDIFEPIQWWDSEARDHVECARICEQCGETLARTLCGECHGGGQRDGGNGTVRECGNCGGAGWLHEGCAEVSYADLVAERDAALAAVERVRAVAEAYDQQPDERELCGAAAQGIRFALDGAPEPERLSIPIPNVPFGPEGVAPTIATASYLIEVVKKIDSGYANVGGSNVTATLRKLLVDTAEALRGLPVKGEPNDDRENLITERTYGHGSITLTHYRSSGRIGVVQRGENSVMDVTDLLVFLQDSGLDEDFSRATVPDAAPTLCVECNEVEVLGKPEHLVLCMDCAYETGRAAVPNAASEAKQPEGWSTEDRREAKCEAERRWSRPVVREADYQRQSGTINGFILGAEWQKARETFISYRAIADEARAERDAALAAIERCRGVLSAWESRQERNREILGNGALGHFQAIDCTGDLRTALDGAPEPEWEVQYGRRNRETGALHWLTGDPRDDWWHENQDRYEHVKRYTSPPLPVEGEKP